MCDLCGLLPGGKAAVVVWVVWFVWAVLRDVCRLYRPQQCVPHACVLVGIATDVLMLLVPLIENPPWTRRTSAGKWEKFVNQKWEEVRVLLQRTAAASQRVPCNLRESA